MNAATMSHPALIDLLGRLDGELGRWATAARRLDDMASSELNRSPQAELQELDALTQHLEQLAAFTHHLWAQARESDHLDIGAVERAAATLSLSALAGRLAGRAYREPVPTGDCEVW